MSALSRLDPEVAGIIEHERTRQVESLEMIASENYASAAVLEATGSVFTNKYAEGYPGKRYYAGNQFSDELENLAIDRAKRLFGVDHANVQPTSGAEANMAVYQAFVNPGDTIMGMELSQGGHLTHGSPVNFSGRLYHFVPYTVDRESETIDMAVVRRLANESRPKIIVAGATAYPRAIDFAAFGEIARESGALLMVDMSHIAGLVAGGVHMSPAPYADVVTTTTHKTLRGPRGALALSKLEHADALDRGVFPGTQGGPHLHSIAAKAVAFAEALRPEFTVYAKQIVTNASALAEELVSGGVRLVSGGSDNHLLLVDCNSVDISGLKAQNALQGAGIITNRNTIPYDQRSAYITSGLRMGTPALTSRGMKEDEMRRVGKWIVRVLKDPDGEGVREAVNAEVAEFARAYPVPGITDAIAV
ncbi:MAG: serine hydroxymethyltransferase [Dehalococcoidia bacterium]|uniref:serine hydroxymethyltransferase n=1 Tax=Candidatus Amarobacter glycogenicus TaxID=3140699 RepID=UPI002A123F3D|nr:serine hydroxymethyltransferase [Dehalococcoidia bacterium]MBK9613432.1 serine hydroxymethyltransferase [Dehalococcoidia bacterium]